MLWEITSFFLQWGASLFSPAAPLGAGIIVPSGNEPSVVTAPASGNVERPDPRRILINPPGSKPVCRIKRC